MSPSASAASALLALALGAPAFAAHPEHLRSLSHRPEPRLSARHTSQPHHAFQPHHTSQRHHIPQRHRPPQLAASSHFHHLIPQPRHLGARAHHHALSSQTSVIAIVRPPNLSRPQLPPVADAAMEPLALPRLYNEHGRLLMPAALVGSHAILLHQNQMADQDGLGRVQNDADLNAMRERGMLVPLPTGPALTVDDRLPFNRRYARPWTAQFLRDVSRDFARRFHKSLQVNSAVRTVEFQQHLIHLNGNAAPAEGDTASPHLTGQAVDLAKRGMSLPEIAWMRGYLLPLMQSGKIDVEEEFQQSCFHISVYRLYAPPAADRYAVATRGTTSSLATVLP